MWCDITCDSQYLRPLLLSLVPPSCMVAPVRDLGNKFSSTTLNTSSSSLLKLPTVSFSNYTGMDIFQEPLLTTMMRWEEDPSQLTRIYPGTLLCPLQDSLLLTMKRWNAIATWSLTTTSTSPLWLCLMRTNRRGPFVSAKRLTSRTTQGPNATASM